MLDLSLVGKPLSREVLLASRRSDLVAEQADEKAKKEIAMSKKILRYAYNPETGNWHLHTPDMDEDYVGDRESVKTFTLYEATLIGGIMPKGVGDFALDMHESLQADRWRKWREAYPAEFYPNEEFFLFD